MNKASLKLVFIFYILEITQYQTLLFASAPVTNMPIISRETKSDLPADLLAEAQKTNMSILKPTDANRHVLYQNYPDGSILFPKNPDVASQFNIMIRMIKQNPDLIEFFRKIHITSLNMLYMYLMKIYTNFNLTNPGTIQNSDGTTTVNLSDYLSNEAMYATNKKKLIMNHFINVIQSQFQASIISYLPATPSDMAVTFGKIFVHNDCGIDLKAFTTPQTDPKIIASQATYINFLQAYIRFFQTYTNCLKKFNAKDMNQYHTIAETISTYLYPQGIPQNLNAPTTSNNSQPFASDPALAKTNPTMFFYDAETLRSIQFIPFAARTMPQATASIPWAPVAVNAATKNSMTNGHAVAFFTDDADKTTPNQANAKHLYILTETGPVLFQQELLAQPTWMNSQDGCIRVLRGCLGDFSALLGMGILDVTLETIIQKAIAPTQR